MDGSGPPAQLRSLYEADEHAWMLEQLALLDAGRVADLDTEHLAEYLRDVTISDRRKLKSRMARLFQHILKFQVQPGRATRSGRLTVLEQQARLRDQLQGTPSLRRYVPELLPDAYAEARRFAAEETELDIAAFPPSPPMTLDEALAWELPALAAAPRRRKDRR